MGNVGTIPATGYESSIDQTFSTPTGTTHTLTYSVASQADILVYINNVAQEPGVGFTLSGTTTLVTDTLVSGDTLYVKYLALARQTVAPGAGTVTAAMMSATGTPSSSTVLHGDDTWAAPSGGAWNLIGTSVASASASLTITGLDSTYDTYAIVLSDLVAATDADNSWLRCGDSGGIDSGATDYEYHFNAPNSGSTAYNGINSAGAAQLLLTGNTGSAAGEGVCGTIYLGRPADGSAYPMFYGMLTFRDQAGALKGSIFNGERSAVITLDRIQFLFSTGNITSGRMSVYGIKHT